MRGRQGCPQPINLLTVCKNQPIFKLSINVHYGHWLHVKQFDHVPVSELHMSYLVSKKSFRRLATLEAGGVQLVLHTPKYQLFYWVSYMTPSINSFEMPMLFSFISTIPSVYFWEPQSLNIVWVCLLLLICTATALYWPLFIHQLSFHWVNFLCKVDHSWYGKILLPCTVWPFIIVSPSVAMFSDPWLVRFLRLGEAVLLWEGSVVFISKWNSLVNNSMPYGL